MLDAAGTFSYQLPEVFAGLSRTESPFPIAYPTAARPQAWAAGTPVLLLQLLLGIQPDRRRHVIETVAPLELPAWTGDVRLQRPARVRPRLGRAARERRRYGDRSMKVAVLSPVWFPVPPTGYGGIEWVVSLLADGLVDAGHDVTLFASGDSRTKAELAWVYEIAPSAEIGRAEVEVRHALACFERAGEFDVINDHSGPPAAVIAGAVQTPTVHTVHGPLGGEPGEFYEQIARVAPRTGLISISMNQRKPHPDLPWIANFPNALDFSFYPVQPRRGDYLLFLGRMSADKGAHRAVAVATRGGPAAEARRASAASPRSWRTSRSSSSRTCARARSSTSARSRTARRSSCCRTRARRCSRSSGRSRSAS